MRLDESNFETWWRWHLYRRWKNDRGRRSMYGFRRHLLKTPDGSLGIDCGANVGDITALVVREGLRVIAFEPDPICIAELHRRFEDERRVTIITKAVGASNRTVPFYRQMLDGQPMTQASSFLLARYHQPEPAVEVEVVDFVEFLDRLGEPVHVLKLDIEGAEAEVLEALFSRGSPRAIGRIFVETHELLDESLAARLQDIRRRALDFPNVDLDWG